VSAQAPANRLTVSRRFYKGKRIRVIVKGGGTSRVRLTVTRGGKKFTTRTIRSRSGVAQVFFKLRKKGTYRFNARLLDGVTLTGSSKPLKVR
jgi:hypothetical protein